MALFKSPWLKNRQQQHCDSNYSAFAACFSCVPFPLFSLNLTLLPTRQHMVWLLASNWRAPRFCLCPRQAHVAWIRQVLCSFEKLSRKSYSKISWQQGVNLALANCKSNQKLQDWLHTRSMNYRYPFRAKMKNVKKALEQTDMFLNVRLVSMATLK